MNYISIKEIMWELLKNPLLTNLTLDDASNSAYSLIKLLKIPTTLITEVLKNNVVDYKTRVPNNTLEVLGVRLKLKDGTFKVLNYGANPYHTSRTEMNDCYKEHTYIVQDCNITTSFEKGEVEIAVKRMATDDEGYPLIPDNESFIKAIKYSIMEEFMEPLWLMGKITDKAFQRIEQQRLWYVGQASSITTKVVNYDHLDMAIKGVNRLLVNTRPKDTFWIGHGENEKIKRYD